MKSCEKSLNSISVILEKVQKKVRRSIRLSKLCAKFQEREIRELYGDLERAKVSLLLDLQILQIHYLRRQSSAAVPQIKVYNTLTDTVETDPSLLRDAPPMSSSIKRRPRSGSRRRLEIRILIWFARYAWYFSVMRCYGGWTCEVKAFNLRPNDSTIFKLVKKGDLAGVKTIMACGNASPLDCLPDGTTLLEVCCKFLVLFAAHVC